MPGADFSFAGSRSREDDAPAVRSRLPTIEPNGSEYLVTINGAVFVALSLAEAEAFVERLRSDRR